MTKMATLELPDNIHIDSTAPGQSSSAAAITASIIQGSGLGRASYMITAADLHPVTNGNGIVKFADDDTAAIDLLRITNVIRCVLCHRPW